MHELVESEIINELPCRCYVRNGEEMEGDLIRHRVGSYGAGTLWCIRRQGTLLLVFNDTPIARRAKNATAEKSGPRTSKQTLSAILANPLLQLNRIPVGFTFNPSSRGRVK
jgi:hypothetical protein